MSNDKVTDCEQNGKESAQINPSRIANPPPGGVFSFAASTLLLALLIVRTRGISIHTVVGMAIFAGGLLKFIGGMKEPPKGVIFGATALASYGCFWMSYATILIPGSGIITTAYSDPQELANAIGLYLVVWFMLTVMLMLHLAQGGGIAGIITALIAYYIAMSELLADNNPVMKFSQVLGERNNPKQ
ncbi:hypothetical protein BYT27DRAFT_7245165 [Phlegmacium glaucopus]|nr:hypothetical protein BYT27DRAFT_7245165 [Phlegmacium glaucopus]